MTEDRDFGRLEGLFQAQQKYLEKYLDDKFALIERRLERLENQKVRKIIKNVTVSAITGFLGGFTAIITRLKI